MVSALWCRIVSSVAGVATFVVAGWLLQGWWWAAAGVGAAAALASQFDHRMSYPIVAAALAACVGAAAADRDGLVIGVVAGVIASIELAAAADRVNLVRPRVPVMSRVTAATGAAAATAAGVIIVGGLENSPGPWAGVVAAAAAVTALRVLVR